MAASCIVVVFAAAACEDEKPSAPGTSVPPSGDPTVVQVRGSERLGWTQAAASADAFRAYSFRIYVDGNPTTPPDLRCGSTAVQGGYECSARLPTLAPGRHVLELASVWNGVESERSQALTVMMASSAQAALNQATTWSTATSVDDPYPSAVVEGLEDVSWLAPVPGHDLLLFVEARRSVRVIQGERLLEGEAFRIQAPADAIVGMAVDPDFARTRAVYLAWTERLDDGAHQVHVSRFRYVGGNLGEAATVVGAIPIASQFSVPLAVDGRGHLYVAVPGGPEVRRVGSDGAFNGFLLRLTTDGTTPADNPSSSPIVAYGFERPASLALDHESGRIWAAGARRSGEHAIVSLTIDRSAPSWPRVPDDSALPGAALPGASITSLSITGAPARLSVVASGVARVAPIASNGTVGPFITLRFGAPGAVAEVADAETGRTFASVRTTDGRVSIYALRD